jgi:hypothetical protein
MTPGCYDSSAPERGRAARNAATVGNSFGRQVVPGLANRLASPVCRGRLELLSRWERNPLPWAPASRRTRIRRKANTVRIINPGDRIEVLATPFAVHVGKRVIVEAVQDLTRG